MSSDKWIDQPSNVRSGEAIDVDRLQSYLSDHLPGASQSLQIKQFPGGFSNLTYAIQWGDRPYVLRRPPLGKHVKSGHDMGREFNVLSALSPRFKYAPKTVLFCENAEVLGAPFYIMERIQGTILRANMPTEMTPEAPVMRGLSISFIDVFAALHAVDYGQAGLTDLGRPNGYTERQIMGWARRYQQSKTDDLPQIDRSARWLSEHLPANCPASLIHNDYKYDNVVLDPNDWTTILAILDWEMATLGNPLMDLGTTLGYWVTRDDPDWMQQLALSPTTLPGNPDRSEVVEMYTQKTGHDVSDIVFYYVYGLFKIAVITQQIYYRYQSGYTKDARFSRLIDVVKGLGLMATRAIEKKRIDRLF